NGIEKISVIFCQFYFLALYPGLAHFGKHRHLELLIPNSQYLFSFIGRNRLDTDEGKAVRSGFPSGASPYGRYGIGGSVDRGCLGLYFLTMALILQLFLFPLLSVN